MSRAPAFLLCWVAAPLALGQQQDECLTDGLLCAAYGQRCHDLNQNSTDDWICICWSPSQGRDVLADIATCVKDECNYGPSNNTGTGGTSDCSMANPVQTCVDRNTSDLSVNDWECQCPEPTVGTRDLRIADCVLNECTQNCSTCAYDNCTVGAWPQQCEDRNTFPASTGDWYCVCDAPNTGEAKAATAVCELNECANHPNCTTCEFDLCTNASQHCVDLYQSPSEDADWECQCVRPYTGHPRTIGVADCILDECTAECATCANSTCSNVTQDCVDTNTSMANLNSWECHCKGDLNGSRPLGQATCDLVECGGTCATCEKAACSGASPTQTCVEQSIAEGDVRDWKCVCGFPYQGEAPRARAACKYDECCDGCDGNLTCGADQECIDRDQGLADIGDFMCMCLPRSKGVFEEGARACCDPPCDSDTTNTTQAAVRSVSTSGSSGTASSTTGGLAQAAEDDDDGGVLSSVKVGSAAFWLLLGIGVQCCLCCVGGLAYLYCSRRAAPEDDDLAIPIKPKEEDTGALLESEAPAPSPGGPNVLSAADRSLGGDASLQGQEDKLREMQDALVTLVAKLETKGIRTDEVMANNSSAQLVEMQDTYSSAPAASEYSSFRYAQSAVSPRSASLPAQDPYTSPHGPPSTGFPGQPRTAGPTIHSLSSGYGARANSGRGASGVRHGDPTYGAPRQGVPSSAASPRANMLYAPRGGMGNVFTSPYSSPKSVRKPGAQ
eukprot:TRINITY_DN2262_c0_g2_i1.p1 TRINITY_DN2262_c0_g2~~TRINITY_DN2262_c0_g2_i1.p1  ORF type:complete len:727 (+),score=127.38 TRINITY_DN2262_c0_g2_i1:51-2231(+)